MDFYFLINCSISLYNQPLNLFRRNMPVEDIADISELSVDEVNDILKKAMVIH